MSEFDEINYAALIDRLIPDFPPVKRLWPISIRLSLWILLEALIVALNLMLKGSLDTAMVMHFHNRAYGAAGFVLVSIAAAWLALRNSIPGRESSGAALILLACGVIGAALTVHFEPSAYALTPSGDFLSILGCLSAFGALPWLALFWAARRAMPLRPRLTGGMIGVASSCFAIAAELFILPGYPLTSEILAGAVLIALSVIAGAIWLNSEQLWRSYSNLSTDGTGESAWLEARTIFPLAVALAVGLLLFVLNAGTGVDRPVPDFDLAIDNYQQSLTNFRPNVPSSSLETVLTAYIERGMPPYMWDFGPHGFKLQGGRFELLADGSPVTYTWFRGAKAGVMCMVRRVSGFEAPSANHFEVHHLLFYRYRGYSVCLINVGGYGDFISVIVSPLPMKAFMRLLVDALS